MLSPSIQRVVTCFILSQSSSPPSTLTSSNNNNNHNHSSNNNNNNSNNINNNNNHSIQIALFHRCSTMPTFANHWAAISGTIEDNETPYQAAQRELQEETNLNIGNDCIVQEYGGLFVNVPFVSPRTQQERIIRVYPFVVWYNNNNNNNNKNNNDNNNDSSSSNNNNMLELRGTEHDEYKFVTVSELEAMEKQQQQSLLVPSLVQTFHHATFGKYQSSIPDKIRQWASDTENGASVMTANAIQLLCEEKEWLEATIATTTKSSSSSAAAAAATTTIIEMAKQISMLRPSMVPIVNVMNQIIADNSNKNTTTTTNILSMDIFQKELQRSVDLGIEEIQKLINNHCKKYQASSSSSNNDTTNDTTTTTTTATRNTFTIATFSRSGTLVKILRHFQQLEQSSSSSSSSSLLPHFKIICSQSTPGNEGELMASDLKRNHGDDSEWVSDDTMKELLSTSSQEQRQEEEEEGEEEEEEQATTTSTTITTIQQGEKRRTNPQQQIDLFLIGSDCIVPERNCIINKVGTTEMCQIAKSNHIPVFCCADRWKLWNDKFPPPLEQDLFEIVPLHVIDKVLVPTEE